MSYIIWEAAVSAGANLTELEKLESGGYSRVFLAKLVAWYNSRNLVEMHTNDAQTKAANKKTR